MSTIKSKIIASIDEIISDFAPYYKNSDKLSIPKISYFMARFKSIISRISYKNSPYYSEMESIIEIANKNRPNWTLETGACLFDLYGILMALKKDISQGYLDNLTELVHADSFSDILQISRELIEKGYKDAAAVTIGVALELHIKNLCKKSEISLVNEKDKLKSANRLTSDLYKDNVIDDNDHKQILYWQGIRNSSAHGKSHKIEIRDVKRMIEGIMDFIRKYPA